MSSIDDVFKSLASSGQTAFMPFITAGDPDLDFTSELLRRLSDAGCHLVELGFPYSDPIADGPVIQDSYTRALDNGISVEHIFEMTAAVAPELKMPLVAMVSFAIVFRHGPEHFLRQASQAGITGIIVPDLPMDECEPFVPLCTQHCIDWVPLITPTTTDARALEIAATSAGFIYYVSIAGITGERTALPETLRERLSWLKGQTQRPICVGFGISDADQARALKSHADGIIVGSAIVRRMADAHNGPHQDAAQARLRVLDDVSTFAQEMIEAARS